MEKVLVYHDPERKTDHLHCRYAERDLVVPFDIIYQMTQGGPGTSTMTLAYIIYQQAFRNHKMGLASALAVVLLLFVLAIHAVQDLFFKEKEGKKSR